MPPHSQHDAFVGPFHGRSLQDSVGVRSRLAAVIPGLRKASSLEDGGNRYASNQPAASPVKEKYSPAAVSSSLLRMIFLRVGGQRPQCRASSTGLASASDACSLLRPLTWIRSVPARTYRVLSLSQKALSPSPEMSEWAPLWTRFHWRCWCYERTAGA